MILTGLAILVVVAGLIYHFKNKKTQVDIDDDNSSILSENLNLNNKNSEIKEPLMKNRKNNAHSRSKSMSYFESEPQNPNAYIPITQIFSEFGLDTEQYDPDEE